MYTLKQLLDYHFQRRPLLQIQDIYKLLYQGFLGAEHLIHDANAARKWLVREFVAQPADNSEPLLEPIALDHAWVRVNLRPFRAQQLEIQNLAEVFLQAATPVKNALPAFMEIWQRFMVQERCSFKIQQIEKSILQFDAEIQRQHFPPMHHSKIYRQNYRPAYRVVNQALFEKTFH